MCVRAPFTTPANPPRIPPPPKRVTIPDQHRHRVRFFARSGPRPDPPRLPPRLPRVSPAQALGSETAALNVSLAQARQILAPDDPPFENPELDRLMKEAAAREKERRVSGGFDGRQRRSSNEKTPAAEITKASSLKVSAGKAAFGTESLQEAFKRYDVDNSGYLDFGEVSVALADMGCLEGVLASKAGELFDDFDVDGDGQVDFDEFEELAARVKELKGSVSQRPAPEVPAGFADSAAALALRRSFEAFAGYGSGGNAGDGADAVTGRDWAKLVRDCGLIGGSVNKASCDIIFAAATGRNSRTLRWEDGTFLQACALIAAEHRVTFGQVASRISQCAPQATNPGASAGAVAGAEERNAAAAARAAAESANGPVPGPDATSPGALRSIFGQYLAASGGGGDAGGAQALAPVEALHAYADLGLLRCVALDAAQAAVTAAVAASEGTPEANATIAALAGATGGDSASRPASSSFVSPAPFAACAKKLAALQSRSAYKAPSVVELIGEDRRRMLASFEAFGGSKHGMRPESFEATVRACGLIGAKVTEGTAAVIFAKCKHRAGGKSAAPKVMTFEGFAQAMAHVAAEYSVKFEVVKDRVFKCTPRTEAQKALETAEKARKEAAKKSEKEANAAPVRKPWESKKNNDRAEAEARAAEAAEARAAAEAAAKAANPDAATTTPADPVQAPLASPCDVPGEAYTDAELIAAYEAFATHVQRGTMSVDEAGWSKIVRACGLVGGALTDAVATRIFDESGARSRPAGRMHFAEWVDALAVVGGIHGVMFKVVETRVKSVAEKQKAAGTASRPIQVVEAEAPPAPPAPAQATAPAATDAGATKKKKKGMFGSMFSSKSKK